MKAHKLKKRFESLVAGLSAISVGTGTTVYTGMYAGLDEKFLTIYIMVSEGLKRLDIELERIESIEPMPFHIGQQIEPFLYKYKQVPV